MKETAIKRQYKFNGSEDLYAVLGEAPTPVSTGVTFYAGSEICANARHSDIDDKLALKVLKACEEEKISAFTTAKIQVIDDGFELAEINYNLPFNASPKTKQRIQHHQWFVGGKINILVFDSKTKELKDPDQNYEAFRKLLPEFKERGYQPCSLSLGYDFEPGRRWQMFQYYDAGVGVSVERTDFGFDALTLALLPSLQGTPEAKRLTEILEKIKA